jgi:hypothetical protein
MRCLYGYHNTLPSIISIYLRSYVLQTPFCGPGIGIPRLNVDVNNLKLERPIWIVHSSYDSAWVYD